MSEERKENQSVQTVSDTKSSVGSVDTNNESIKIFGIVESCGQLRVRKEPNKEADVIATIPVGTLVELENDEVIDGFYAVHTEVEMAIVWLSSFRLLDLKRSDYMAAERMNDSILTSVKKMLGLSEEYDAFDLDIITHINSVFTILTQIGVGSGNGFMIEDKTPVWTDFIQDSGIYQLVKSYMVLKVRLLFDPPMSSAVLECYKTQVNEYEWRLKTMAENQEVNNQNE